VFTRKVKSAGGVVLNQNGEVLVVDQNGDSWCLPKGHIEEGETALDAAKREIAEESGVKNLIFIKELPSYKRYRIGLDGKDDLSELKTIHMFLFRTNETDLSPTDPHNTEARWVKKEEVYDILTHRKDKEFFQSIAFEVK